MRSKVRSRRSLRVAAAGGHSVLAGYPLTAEAPRDAAGVLAAFYIQLTLQ